jgi:pimeloyl-ACP methyl ester carboxylesterase
VPTPAGFPAPIRATTADLPPAVAAALAQAPEPRRSTVTAAGVPFAVIEWGAETSRPILLVHGVTSSSAVWWRTGPALAVAGWRVVAIDMPGHGRTGHWNGHHRFRDAADDVAAFARAAGIARADGGAEDPSTGLVVLGHSWGAGTAAELPRAGVRPARLVLLDPVVLPQAMVAAMLDDPVERHYDDLGDAMRAIGAANRAWSYGDVLAKAEALTQVDPVAARAILLVNGDWDGGLAALRDPAAAGLETWVIRGEPPTGGLLPDEALPAFATVVGAERILTVEGGPHSPQRTHPEAFLAALLRALA